jgi:hypothetical protein
MNWKYSSSSINKTMAKYAGDSPASKDKEDLNDPNEEKNVDEHDNGVSSVPSGGTFRCISSVELNSQSSKSQQSSSRSSGSVHSSSSSGSHPFFTNEMYTQLMASSDKWKSEGDVILDMNDLSLSETKVSIHSELMAGIVFDS